MELEITIDKLQLGSPSKGCDLNFKTIGKGPRAQSQGMINTQPASERLQQKRNDTINHPVCKQCFEKEIINYLQG